MCLTKYISELNETQQSIEDLVAWTDVKHSKGTLIEAIQKIKSFLGKNNKLVVFSVILNGFESIDKGFEEELSSYISGLKKENRYLFRSDVCSGKRISDDVIVEWLECNQSREAIESKCEMLYERLCSINKAVLPTIGVLVYSSEAPRKLSSEAVIKYPIQEAKKAKEENKEFRVYEIT